jgi:integrase
MSAKDMIDLISNPGMIDDIDIHNGILGNGKRGNVPHSTPLTPEEVKAFKEWKRRNGK